MYYFPGIQTSEGWSSLTSPPKALSCWTRTRAGGYTCPHHFQQLFSPGMLQEALGTGYMSPVAPASSLVPYWEKRRVIASKCSPDHFHLHFLGEDLDPFPSKKTTKEKYEPPTSLTWWMKNKLKFLFLSKTIRKQQQVCVTQDSDSGDHLFFLPCLQPQ